ncbi:nuclear transport factor 2 family protein [Roseibium sp. MMSF_3412]|uniref:nuclear transport factor 2 family protein n=1 Tax=Roseibium sp. MMSF_3412 TaxID=3046712 RepID=UPI00273D0DF1|nr:nuclear transport factor 2 family protein [Roseibium sp. MMSF_3412]
MDLQQVLASYAAAWNETDPERRLRLLERCWSDGGQYADPAGTADGREQLSAYIGEFHAHMPGARIELVSGASQHNAHFYFKWQLITGDGIVKIDGVDFGTVSADGRLQEIVGFFGAPPELTGS